ncbi:substrate-binding domain-containing protein [Actinopolymorpha pittospori]|uniref:Aldouronate transport system substrate-binding protein n=1 Tax=Actinopolymorpha pittospori TaxID=648752 RepID=A0A927RA97_9ACTN|nr:substrate-binding domain-containing protein [Actinopolymorpha pittospori]MBE1608732.1 putative aldouronate transport system substrate-binding protein [Actinopolymorpha pittospori]
MARPSVSRRTFLRGAGGAALLASGAGSLLTACGSSGATSEEAQKKAVTANKAVKLPTNVPYTGVHPDLAGEFGYVRPGFFSYPKEHPKSVQGEVGSGGSVSAMANIYYPIPPTAPKNKYWAELNKRLNADLKMTMVPNADYTNKFATTIAGGDLPDFTQIIPVANLPQLLEAKFANLTEFLSGDAIKDYPNLASIPERSWQACIFNGGIYGIPVPRDAVGGFPFIRADIFEKFGLPTQPKDYEEFHTVAKGLSDAKAKRWAFATATAVRDLGRTMLSAPNTWHNEGGKLTHRNETEQERRAVDIARQFWKEGLIHPDAFGQAVPFKQWFNAGTICIHSDGYQGWTQYIQDNVNTPGFKLDLMLVPAYDGGGPGKISHGGSTFLNGMTGIKKGDKTRIQELLRIANWLAAPFGSDEYFFRLYGQEGVHHTIDNNGDPKYTPVGLSETVIPIRYIAEGPSVTYQPGRKGDVEIQHTYEQTVVPDGIPNPCLGLYSNTQQSKGATIDAKLTDEMNAVIQGRKPLSAWDDAVATWLKEGGEQIRKEYQDQIQERGANTK